MAAHTVYVRKEHEEWINNLLDNGVRTSKSKLISLCIELVHTYFSEEQISAEAKIRGK